jgi:3-methylcrotonyl-CoA carboxylase alpha subunit
VIQSLLIANRGEIACRIMRSAHRLGIRNIAVFSDADANALHVRMADEAVHIGPSPATESYLRGDKIIAAAKATGAEAIHPGYGFLSENADFAQAVTDAGLVWVGPKPDSIRAMGLKDAAKKLMADAGVPVTPGYLGEDQDPKRLQKEADAIGYPVLIKAVAGGGGKGMRKVDAAKDFQDALESCKREAASSFGNDVVLLEKWIESPRHIEVQVFGDTHGNVVHLFERDCSLQRRHQKIIEEAPAPGMDAETREAVCSAAVRAARAVNYEGAGTVEFIADASDGLRADRIWFMEMNTRLQVEHPVTEAITGVDLVRWQILAAAGEPLPKRQDELSINGHAMEARLYAEDPAKGFLPSAGKIDLFDFGEAEVRIDTGFQPGDTVTPFYDPMIAKIIAWGESRPRANSNLLIALGDAAIWPLRTNAQFLVNALGHPDFTSGEIDTGFISRFEEQLVAPDDAHPNLWRSAALEFIAAAEGDVPEELAGFRLNSAQGPRATLSHEGDTRTVDLSDDGAFAIARAEWQDERLVMFMLGGAYAFDLPGRANAASASAVDGAIVAPMPGKITSVEISQGDKVAKGQRLLTLEAMKMEHGLVAPFDGVIAVLSAKAGAQVSEGTVLALVENKEQT